MTVHPVATIGGLSLDEERVRRWLGNLRRPERLADPVMRDLLRAHGRPASGAPLDVGGAGAALLRDVIDALRPPAGATTGEQLPHLVLTTCFVDGAKSYQAAGRLGLSERQLSRERARAISLLTAALAATPRGTRASLPHFPGAIARPGPAGALQGALAASTRVHVWGAPGVGKTSLVAAHAATTDADVVWLTVVPPLSSELPALLFDLGAALAPDDPSLDAYMRGSLPVPNLGLATRIALAALGGRGRLLVLDGFDAVAGDAAVEGFLTEALARLPALKIVTVGRNPVAGSAAHHVRVRAFTARETADLLGSHGIDGAPAVHRLTGGAPRLVERAARLLAAPGGPEAAAAATALRREVGAGPHLLRAAAGLVAA